MSSNLGINKYTGKTMNMYNIKVYWQFQVTQLQWNAVR